MIPFNDGDEEKNIERNIRKLSNKIDKAILNYVEKQSSNELLPHVILSALASALIKLVALTGDRDFIFDTLQDMVPEQSELQQVDVDLSIPISIKRH